MRKAPLALQRLRTRLAGRLERIKKRMPDFTRPFVQSPSGAILVAMDSLFNRGFYTPEINFKEIRIVRDEDWYHVHLLGSRIGSYLVSVPRRNRVTSDECPVEKIETDVRLCG